MLLDPPAGAIKKRPLEALTDPAKMTRGELGAPDRALPRDLC